MNFREVRGPYGGANSFLATLRRAFEDSGVKVVTQPWRRFDVALLNALTNDIECGIGRSLPGNTRADQASICDSERIHTTINLLGRDITVFGDGLQTRSFCYVDDLVDVLMRLMNTADAVTGPINVGNPHEFTILELASQVLDLTGSRSRIVHRPRPQDDPRQRRPDISKANDLLGWAPQTALRDGLVKTIEYFEDLLKDEAIRPFIVHELGAEA